MLQETTGNDPPEEIKLHASKEIHHAYPSRASADESTVEARRVQRCRHGDCHHGRIAAGLYVRPDHDSNSRDEGLRESQARGQGCPVQRLCWRVGTEAVGGSPCDAAVLRRFTGTASALAAG